MAGAEAGGGRDLPLGAIAVPWSVVVPEVDVHVVGYGTRLPNDFTLELLAVLRRCRRVFGDPPIRAAQFGIPEMEDLRALGDALEAAGDAVQRRAEVVLAAAAGGGPVALATAGSPLAGCAVAHRVVARAAELGLSVHVSHGVPPFDAVWADFNIEPFYGCEIWDAGTFLWRGIEPSTRTCLLLTGGSARDGRALRSHLLRFYPSDHVVGVAPDGVGVGPHVLATGNERLALGDLADCHGTLVVPRLGGDARTEFGAPAPP